MIPGVLWYLFALTVCQEVIHDKSFELRNQKLEVHVQSGML